MYDRVLALQTELQSQYHYTQYTAQDYIFTKAWTTFVYDFHWDPYICRDCPRGGFPCFRIYDPNIWLYALTILLCINYPSSKVLLPLTSYVL